MAKTIGELKTFVEQFTKALNALVEGVALVARDEVAEFLSQYNELVPECDERLLHVASLLSKGLRDEALGYEADDPALLESVTLLDLSSRPQWPQWLEALRALGFPQPAMPKMEIAVELREAQEQLATLKPNLDDWRRANLANVPLATRIMVLRRLRKADPNNEAWFECLTEHERRRLTEIEADAKSACAAKDEARLAMLADELKSQWIESPPARIRAGVDAALTSIRASRIDSSVATAAESLAAAFAARDVDAGRQLRDRWNQLVAEKGAFRDDDPSLEHAAPAVEWIGWHDRLESLFSEVWQSLDARPATRQAERDWVRSLGRMRDEVEDLAEKLGEEIDLEPIERLRARVDRVAEEHLRQQRGRQWLMYVAVGGVAAVIVATVFTVVSLVSHRDRVKTAVAEINSLLQRVERGEVEPEAVPDLGFPEWLTADPTVSARVMALRGVVDREADRRRRYRESMAKLDDAVAGLAELSRGPSLDAWPEPFVPATKLLREIANSRAAKTEVEKAGIVKAEGRLQNAARRFQRDADEALAAKVQDIATRLAKVGEQVVGNRDKAAEALFEIEGEVTTLRELAEAPAAPGADGPFAEYRKVSRGAVRPLAPDGDVGRKIDGLKAMLEETGRFAAAERAINEAIGAWGRYAERLEAAAADFPRHAVSLDYAEAAKDAGLWQAVDEWSTFAGGVGSFASLTAEQAKARAAELARMRDVAGKLPFAVEFLDRHESWVKAFAERDLAELRLDLTEWLEREWLGELEWVVTTDPGADGEKVHYAIQKPRDTDPNFKYQRQMKTAGRWPDPKVSRPTKDDASALLVVRSPQKILADDLEANCVSRIPDRAAGFALDEMLIDAISRTLAASKVEPCLRMLTLRKLLMRGRDLSPLFQSQAVMQLLAELDDGNGGIPGVQPEELGEFLDPDRDGNAAYGRVRKVAERILGRAAPVLAELKVKMGQVRAALEAPSPSGLMCVGRLARDTGGDIVVVLSPGATMGPGADLSVIGPGGAVASVGRVGPDGRAALTSNAKVAGVPVFVWQRKDKK
jgi:hypothetical protein